MLMLKESGDKKHNKAINTTTNARHSRSELAAVFSVVYQYYRNTLLAYYGKRYKHKECIVGKFAILSDIHSNIFALEAVVKDARAKGFTDFVNLGDILYGPIAPRQTYEYLQSLGAITISGNQDRQIYEATEAEIESNPTMQ
ncbi:metallophosphoesterase family protein, partial [Photobacterium kagoshimensis]|uniref:metallophosphoesterase family protein n=1 Tax=Photobacterium kagoshimensis TaxID=2910242 RepID=UPI003D0AF3CB